MSKFITLDTLKSALAKFKSLLKKPDWNENDESADGYIANRPFYTETEPVVEKVNVITNASFKYASQGYYNINGTGACTYPQNIELTEGTLITITIETEKFTGQLSASTANPDILDFVLSGQKVNGYNVPSLWSFNLEEHTLTLMGVGNTSDPAMSFSITAEMEQEREKVHKLDSKYLPEYNVKGYELDKILELVKGENKCYVLDEFGNRLYYAGTKASSSGSSASSSSSSSSSTVAETNVVFSGFIPDKDLPLTNNYYKTMEFRLSDWAVVNVYTQSINGLFDATGATFAATKDAYLHGKLCYIHDSEGYWICVSEHSSDSSSLTFSQTSGSSAKVRNWHKSDPTISDLNKYDDLTLISTSELARYGMIAVNGYDEIPSLVYAAGGICFTAGNGSYGKVPDSDMVFPILFSLGATSNGESSAWVQDSNGKIWTGKMEFGTLRLTKKESILDSITGIVTADKLTSPDHQTDLVAYDAFQAAVPLVQGMNLTGATVGQTIKVKTVDTDGRPTSWEAADMAGGETWETLAEATLEEESVPILDIGAMASTFSNLRFYFTFPIVESVETVQVRLCTSTSTGLTYRVMDINRGNEKSETWAFIDFYPLIYNGICYVRMIQSSKVGFTEVTKQFFQYSSYDYNRIPIARYVSTNKVLPAGTTITILGVRK